MNITILFVKEKKMKNFIDLNFSTFFEMKILTGFLLLHSLIFIEFYLLRQAVIWYVYLLYCLLEVVQW